MGKRDREKERESERGRKGGREGGMEKKRESEREEGSARDNGLVLLKTWFLDNQPPPKGK